MLQRSEQFLVVKRDQELAGLHVVALADQHFVNAAADFGADTDVACFDRSRALHDRLKSYAATAPGVVNAAVEFDDVNLRPTYKLIVGVPGGSSGIAIARRLGLANQIIDRARDLLSPESREASDLIAYLHRSREELDRMQQQMAAERSELQAERGKLRTE